MLIKSSFVPRALMPIALIVLGSAGLAEAGSGGGDHADREVRADRADRSGGNSTDRADKAAERASRDTTRAAERAQRDQDRYEEDRTKILRETANDPERQQRELAKLEADRAEDLAKAQEEAAKIAEDLAEELAKAQEDADRDADERVGEGYGSSEEMRDLADTENPDFDPRGFPVRRGEVLALDLDPAGRAAIASAGFVEIDRAELPALGSSILRLQSPLGLALSDALALARSAVPGATFDYTHYYQMQMAPAGSQTSTRAGKLPARRKGNLRIGMIDTAVDKHSALGQTKLEMRDFATGRGTRMSNHGTAVASILALEGTSRLHVASVFHSSGGKPFTSSDALASALEWMVGDGVQVVNMSLAGPRNAVLDKLIEQSVGRGTVIVAAAGNGGPTAPPAYPAALSSVVAVTAVDSRDRVYRYANQGKYITVAAHGVEEPVADAQSGGVQLVSGTSFATPHVSAWMARCRQKNDGAACVRKLRNAARDVGKPGFDPVYGFGVVD